MALAVETVLQTAATTGNGTAAHINNSTQAQFIVTAVGTVTSGVVQLEISDDPAYTGTWAPISTTISPTTGTKLARQVTGPFGFVRARISTNIGGGGSINAKVIAC